MTLAQSALGDVTLAQYLLVAAVAFVAATIGGLSGYGTGLLLPPVLVPIIGPEAVVPVIGVSALFTNASRIVAFRQHLDRKRALTMVLLATPTCILGAYGYTRLSGAGIALMIGLVLIALVPLRRVLQRRRLVLGGPVIAGAAGLYGLLAGGTTGAGVVLISLLLAAGLNGAAVVATDAGISFVLSLVKIAIFQSTGALPLSSWIMAGVVGVAALPGAFVARALVDRISGRAHLLLLDAVVLFGGGTLVIQGFRGLV